MIVGDGDDAELLGGDPGGEIAGVVLDEESHEALDAAENGAVDHDGSMGFVVVADVFEGEAFG